MSYFQLIDYVKVVVILAPSAVKLKDLVSRESHLFDLVGLPKYCIEEYLERLLGATTINVGSMLTASEARAIVVLQRFWRKSSMHKRAKCHVVAFGRNKSVMVLNAKAIPNDLTNFVEYLTQGNPLFIVETVEQLILQKHIEISQYGRVEVKKNLMEDVKFFEWSHTSMVAGIMCQIEALSPSESAVIKMGCVFEGPFTILDVAASLTASNGKWLDNIKLQAPQILQATRPNGLSDSVADRRHAAFLLL
jgi:hypothetical protein